MARDVCKVGLTVAPIQPFEGWRAGHATPFEIAAAELGDGPNLDLTAELIIHRFTPKSKAVLQGWYSGSHLEMDEEQRSRKLTKFGSVEHVYPAATMRKLEVELTASIAGRLPVGPKTYLDLETRKISQP